MCQCISPYTGVNCTQKICKAGCVHGHCTYDGTCACETGWTGSRCETSICPSACSGNGVCDIDLAFCRCSIGFSGPDCSLFNPDVCITACQFKCSLYGTTGLIPVKENDIVHYISSRECNQKCVEEGCSLMTSTGVNEIQNTHNPNDRLVYADEDKNPRFSRKKFKQKY
jgi:hypothetical protein